jgi:glutamate 5-kinase
MDKPRDLSVTPLKRVVVKVGSNVLTADQSLNLPAIRAISRQICRLMDRGIEVILVSSGAMASGVRKVGLARRPDEIPKRQAVAAVGQAGLILEYEKAFQRYGRKVAQILLTSEDLANRVRYLNARNTLNVLLSWNIVPIVNENDTVMVDEITFGDNDTLAAMIALLMDADILIVLTDIDGLFSRDPRVHNDAELISEITAITRGMEKIASDIPGALGKGGMLSKIKAARKVTSAGVPMIIARGDRRDILPKLLAGRPLGTYFVPNDRKLARRKCWIAFSLKPKGTITIDDGAARAILQNGKSLLPSGIVAADGDFGIGAPVECCNRAQESLGIGLVNYSAADIRRIMGLKTSKIRSVLGYKPYDEVIHRDNLAITARYRYKEE